MVCKKKYIILKTLALLILFVSQSIINPGYCLPLKELFSVTYHQSNEFETIELLFSNRPDYNVFELKNPSRLVLDFKACYFKNLYDSIEVGALSARKIRVSQFQANKVRIVVDQGDFFPEPEFETLEDQRGEILLVKLRSDFPTLQTNRKPCATNNKSNKNSGSKDTAIDIESKAVENEPNIEALTGLDDENLGSLFSAPATESPSLDADNMDADFTEAPSKMTVTGDYRMGVAYRLRKPHQFSKIKNDLNLIVSGVLSENLSYVIGSRLTYDAVFDLTDNYNEDVESDQKTMADLRDAYVDLSWGNCEIRVGNQQIVWGQAVGLFFADIVNPKDLREYILPDLDQVRIPVPAVNLEYYPGNLYFQFVYIPFPEFNEFGKKGSEFDFSRSFYAQDADIVMNDPLEPSNTPSNSELGLRVSKLTGGWDLSLFYLYDYYNFPVNYRYISSNSKDSSYPVTITYQPEYERMHRFGHTFSKEYMDAVFKGEFIYNHEMFIQSLDTTDPDGIKESNTFEWLIGFDYTFSNSLETNFQLMQNIILDYEQDMAENKYATYFSIWLKRGFFEDKIEPELFFVASLNQRDYLLRPKLVYNYNDHLKFILGADIFYGEIDGDFGMFDNNDRFYIEIFYHF